MFADFADLRFAVFAFGGLAEVLDFLRLEFAGFTGLQVEDEGSVSDSADLFNTMADLFKHLAQLAVAPLDQNNLEPRILCGCPALAAGFARAIRADLRVRGLYAARTGLPTIDAHSFTQAVNVLF